MSHKSVLRQRLILERKQLDAKTRSQWDAQIQAQVLQLCNTLPITQIGIYHAIKAEPDLQACYIELIQQGKQLALPVVTDKNAPLAFVPWQPDDAMEKDAYGIAIPVRRETRIQPQALLIPCVGWHSLGYRLGYGGGFYDRTLAHYQNQKHHCLPIGIAYAQSLSEFEVENWDQAMRYLIHEKASLKFE